MLRAVFVVVFAALPLLAFAQSYRCVGKDGKKYYGSQVPTECIGQPVEQLNNQGMVMRRFDAAASAAEREKKSAEDDERKKREAVSKEEGRRNRALLATYTSDKDIESSRKRALQDNETAVKDIERRIDAMKKRRGDMQKEMDAASKGGAKPPAKLAEDLRSLDFDLTTQEGLLETKRKDAAAINARYDDDKKRYAELTKNSTK